jgi:hypothetical protein
MGTDAHGSPVPSAGDRRTVGATSKSVVQPWRPSTPRRTGWARCRGAIPSVCIGAHPFLSVKKLSLPPAPDRRCTMPPLPPAPDRRCTMPSFPPAPARSGPPDHAARDRFDHRIGANRQAPDRSGNGTIPALCRLNRLSFSPIRMDGHRCTPIARAECRGQTDRRSDVDNDRSPVMFLRSQPCRTRPMRTGSAVFDRRGMRGDADQPGAGFPG